MKIVSYYKEVPDRQEGFGMSLPGLCARQYWADAIGKALPHTLAGVNGTYKLVARPHPGSLSIGSVTTYPIEPDDYDVSYCEVFDIPQQRPHGFVYGAVDDIIGREPQLRQWLDRVRPDVLLTMHDNRTEVHALCAKYGCRCVYFPWFITTAQPYYEDKQYTAVSTGARGLPCYPQRTRIFQYLSDLDRPDVLSLPTDNQAKYPLSSADYERIIARTRYFVTSGTWDFEISGKYMEVCNYGAALVSFELPDMAFCGWVDGVNYCRIESVEQIGPIIDSDAWRTVAPAGQRLIQQKHTLGQRAKQLRALYDDR